MVEKYQVVAVLSRKLEYAPGELVGFPGVLGSSGSENVLELLDEPLLPVFVANHEDAELAMPDGPPTDDGHAPTALTVVK